MNFSWVTDPLSHIQRDPRDNICEQGDIFLFFLTILEENRLLMQTNLEKERTNNRAFFCLKSNSLKNLIELPPGAILLLLLWLFR